MLNSGSRGSLEKTVSTRWRAIAWNGIRFEAPADWEIGKIGLRYLMLETETGPVMEVKWNPVKGKFSPKAHLRRLAAMHHRKLRKTFRKQPLPADWAQALADFDAIGFSWHARSVAGRGAITYCHHCRTAALIQFLSIPSDRTDPDIRKILESFRDHSDRGVVIWSIFDIRAEVPAKFRLKTYRFDAGEYELIFSNKKLQITMHRWSPASILLQQYKLEELIQTRLDLDPKQAPTLKTIKPGVVEGDLRPPSRWALWKYRLQRKPIYRCIRVWHAAEKNRILSVQLAGKSVIDRDLFTLVCNRYEVFS